MKINLLKTVMTIALFFLMNSLSAQGIIEYKQFVQVNFPQFLQHFQNLDFQKFDTGYKEDLNFADNNYTPEDWNLYAKKYKAFLVYNRDKSFEVDLLSAYIDIELKNGIYYGSADVDQAILLGDVNNRKLIQISFCGPSCRYEEAKWINDYTFIVLGWYMDDDKYVPSITIVNLIDKTRISYMNEAAAAKKPYEGNLFKKIRFE